MVADARREESARVWVDWLKEFRDRVDELRDPSLSVADKKRFLNGIVEKVTVSGNSEGEHEVGIPFAFPYVNDQLVYPKQHKKKRVTARRRAIE